MSIAMLGALAIAYVYTIGYSQSDDVGVLMRKFVLFWGLLLVNPSGQTQQVTRTSVVSPQPDNLARAVTALEQAHHAYESAKVTCSLRARALKEGIPGNGETLAINWGFIEKDTEELLASKSERKASEMIRVLGHLQLERRVLNEALFGCIGKEEAPFTVSVTIADAIVGLDDATEDLEWEIQKRVWALEAGNKAAREHPELFCPDSENKSRRP